MIKLSADESMLLLVAKKHSHKDVPKLKDEDTMSYIQRVCKYRCFNDAEAEWEADVFAIYAPLAEKLLTTRQIIRAMEYLAPSRHTWTYTPLEMLISELSNLQIQDRIELDESLIKYSDDFLAILNWKSERENTKAEE